MQRFGVLPQVDVAASREIARLQFTIHRGSSVVMMNAHTAEVDVETSLHLTAQRRIQRRAPPRATSCSMTGEA